jgi:hypothetical protein
MVRSKDYGFPENLPDEIQEATQGKALKNSFGQICKGMHRGASKVYGPCTTTNLPTTKARIFQTEELTNYAAHAALVLRHSLDEKDSAGAPPPLPERPDIPELLRSSIQFPKDHRCHGYQ